MDKERYARYARKLSEQMGCVDRFKIDDPADEEWFLETTKDQHRYYEGKMNAMTTAETEVEEAKHEAVKENLAPTDDAA